MKRLSDKYSRETYRDDAKIKKNVLRKEGEKKPSKASTSNQSRKVNSTHHATLSRTLRGTRK